MVFGGAASERGAEIQYQTPAIATAAATLANIRPNALRIAISFRIRPTPPKTGCAVFAPGH